VTLDRTGGGEGQEGGLGLVSWWGRSDGSSKAFLCTIEETGSIPIVELFSFVKDACGSAKYLQLLYRESPFRRGFSRRVSTGGLSLIDFRSNKHPRYGQSISSLSSATITSCAPSIVAAWLG
jgi:hypothetical protein